MNREMEIGEDDIDDEYNVNDPSEWKLEALRLSQRIMELELENTRLRSELRLGGNGIYIKSKMSNIPTKPNGGKKVIRRSENKYRSHQSLLLHRDQQADEMSASSDHSTESCSALKTSWSCSELEDLEDHGGPVRNMVKSIGKVLQDTPSNEERENVVEDLKEPVKHQVAKLGDRFSGKRSRGEFDFWVGTWNMGAADPFSDNLGQMDDRNISVMLEPFVPHGYDVYVIGVQEGVSDRVYDAMERYLNLNDTAQTYKRMSLKNSTFLLPDKSSPSDGFLDAVRGRGDGALMGTKFTGLAIFVADSIRDQVILIRSAVHKFNITSGSKGGVAAAIRIRGSTIAFLNCHLDAKNDSNRREQIRLLNANLGKNMGVAGFELTEMFHHVVWMGDLNYRIHTLDGYTVLHMLGEGQNQKLHDKFDGLSKDRERGVFHNFKEPKKWPTFYPTYKKYEHRGKVDTGHSSWPSSVYRVQYKEPFYKGGQVKARVPGWCDRILVHSMDCNSTLCPEQCRHPTQDNVLIDHYKSINDGVGMDVSDHSPVCGTFILTFPLDLASKSQRSRSLDANHAQGIPFNVTSPTNASSCDSHVPRSSDSYFDQSSFVAKANKNISRPVSTVIRLFNMNIQWNNNRVTPKKVRVVAPLVGEDNVKQTDVQCERVPVSSGGYAINTNAVLQHTNPLETLHLLLWIKLDTLQGHCVVPFNRFGKASAGKDVSYILPLMQHSAPAFQDNKPVLVSFSLRAKMFAK